MAITADSVRRNHARMVSARGNFDAGWGEIARLVYPEMDRFTGGGFPGAWDRWPTPARATMHDPYAAQALEDGVSLFEGFVMPRGQRWQKLALDEDLMRSVENQQWVEKIEQRLFRLRHDPESGFVGAVHESAMGLYSFAAQSMWIDIRYSKVTGNPLGLTYQSEFIGEIFVEWDAAGRPYRLHRSFTLPAEAAALKFGADVPAVVKEALRGTNAQPDRPFDFIHVIEPNTAYDAQRWDAAGMPWASAYYLAGGEEEVFRRGGYRSLPRVFSTFTRGPRTGWGFSPAMRVLPQIRLLQEITRDRVFGAELRLLPPMLATDDELDGSIVELKGLGITYGGLDERGQPKLQPFLNAADSTDAERLAMEARAMIDKAFGRDLLQINRELKTHITALRTAEEREEKGVLLAPLARQEAEWLAPMTQRELALMGEIGLMDDMPGEVAEYFAAEGAFHWRYDNQLSRMMKAQDTVAFLSLAEQVGVLAQFDNNVINDFRREYPMSRVLQTLGENAGVPASMKATDAEKRDFDEESARQQQMQALLQAAPVIADAAKNAAQAGAIAA